MSTYTQHATVGGANFELTAGWDPVLHRFFMVLEDADDENSERPLYSNLDDKDLNEQRYQSLQYFKDKFKQLDVGFEVEARIWEAMRVDQINDD